jgi:hypothetical protein
MIAMMERSGTAASELRFVDKTLDIADLALMAVVRGTR